MSGSPVPGRPDALMGPTLPADTAVHVRSIGAVLKVVSAGRCKGGIQHLGPFRVGLRQPPHLVRGQPKITEHLPKRLAGIDPIEELLPQLGW
jgi:hypothetical protein